MPLMRLHFGYSGRLRPVPMPTSSTWWPGRMSHSLTAASRPGWKIQSKTRS